MAGTWKLDWQQTALTGRMRTGDGFPCADVHET